MHIDTESAWFKQIGSNWLRYIDPELVTFVSNVNQLGEKDIRILPEEDYIADRLIRLSDRQLQRWIEDVDKTIIFILRLLSAILFFRAVRHAKYFYEKKQELVNLARIRGRRITAPYYLRVMSSLNGTCAAWLKIKREARAYGRGVYGTFDYLGRIDHKTPRSSIRTNNKELKALICDELEPKFAILREQTDLMGKAKNLLKTIHFQTKKVNQ